MQFQTLGNKEKPCRAVFPRHGRDGRQQRAGGKAFAGALFLHHADLDGLLRGAALYKQGRRASAGGGVPARKRHRAPPARHRVLDRRRPRHGLSDEHGAVH